MRAWAYREQCSRLPGQEHAQALAQQGTIPTLKPAHVMVRALVLLPEQAHVPSAAQLQAPTAQPPATVHLSLLHAQIRLFSADATWQGISLR